MKGNGQVIIGVLGLHPCAGATHLSILLAAYFSHCKRKRTFVTETGGKNGLRCFEIFLHGEEGAADEFHSRRCCYRKSGLGRAAGTACERAEYLIYDLGCSYMAVKEQLKACDSKWVIGSSGIFHKEDWKKFFEESGVKEQIMLQGAGEWHFLQNHSRTGKKIKTLLEWDGWSKRIEIYGLGAEEDLLHPSKAAISLFSKMET